MALATFRFGIEVNLIGSFNVVSQFAARLVTAEPLGEERGVWNNFSEFVTTAQRDKRPPPMATGCGIYVLVEGLGDDEEGGATSFAAALESLIEQDLITDAVIAQLERQRQELWATRDDVIHVMATIKPRYAYDVSMALSDMARFVEDSEMRVARALPGATLMFYGHGGDGNLHVVVGPGDVAGGYEVANDAVYAATQGVGGSNCANGLAFSPDGTRLYLSDSPKATVECWTRDRAAERPAHLRHDCGRRWLRRRRDGR